jgi:hypothetical protein
MNLINIFVGEQIHAIQSFSKLQSCATKNWMVFCINNCKSRKSPSFCEILIFPRIHNRDKKATAINYFLLFCLLFFCFLKKSVSNFSTAISNVYSLFIFTCIEKSKFLCKVNRWKTVVSTVNCVLFCLRNFLVLTISHLKQSGYDPLASYYILNPTYLLHANGQGGIMNI